MYEGIHSLLEESGIDGVKVDVIHVSPSILIPQPHIFYFIFYV